VAAVVEGFAARSIVTVLSLQHHAPGRRPTDNNPMPNRDHSPAFWASVAARFDDHPYVVFDLVNEPHPDDNRNSEEAWRCWRDGGRCRGVVDRATGTTYEAAGIQELLGAVRGTGAGNLVLVPGVSYGNALSGWLGHRPADPAGNTAVSWHVYDGSRCATVACFDAEVVPVLREVPVLVTEIGPDRVCACEATVDAFAVPLLDRLEVAGTGFLAWTWNPWPSYSAALVEDWDGTPSPVWGSEIRRRLTRPRVPPAG
jgi:endoglucanase